MTFHLFDDVLLLHLTLKPAKGILNCFALLKFYFCQTKNTSIHPLGDLVAAEPRICKVLISYGLGRKCQVQSDEKIDKIVAPDGYFGWRESLA